MMSWNKYDPRNTIIPEGFYIVKIDEASEIVSRHSQKEMAKLRICVLDKGILFYYLVYDYERIIDTNRKFKAIYESFGLPEGSTDVKKWVGATGIACVKHRVSFYSENQDEAYISYFIPHSDYPELAFPDTSAAQAEDDAEDFVAGDMTGDMTADMTADMAGMLEINIAIK